MLVKRLFVQICTINFFSFKNSNYIIKLLKDFILNLWSRSKTKACDMNVQHYQINLLPASKQEKQEDYLNRVCVLERHPQWQRGREEI